MTDLRLEVGPEVMEVENAKRIAHGHIPIALGQCSTGHPGGLFGNRFDGTGVE